MSEIPQLRLFDELSYSIKNRKNRYEILEGAHKGKKLMYHSVSSYGGDIDFIKMRAHTNTKIFSFHENLLVKIIKETNGGDIKKIK